MSPFLQIATAFAIALGLSTPTQAAVLDIGTDACAAVCGNGGTIEQDYGDRTGLDVTFASSGGGAMFYWEAGYSPLSGVAYASSGQGGSITFSPEQEYKFTLRGFRLGAWQGVARDTSYRIYNGRGDLLFDSGTITVSATGLDVAGKWRGRKGIVLEFGPEAYYVGIDMIDYRLKQETPPLLQNLAVAKSGPNVSAPPVPAVPVPAALPLLAGAIVALGVLRRRRRAT